MRPSRVKRVKKKKKLEKQHETTAWLLVHDALSVAVAYSFGCLSQATQLGKGAFVFVCMK